MFWHSVCLRAWFWDIVYHLFDASWSVPTRRLCKNMACLFCWTMPILFLPVAFTAKWIYPWMTQATPDHSVRVKYPIFTMTGYYVTAAVLFGIWWLYSNRLRYWSLRQDETG